MSQRVAIIGGGWAGLAAAVGAVERGHRVTVFEMAPTLGGRARAVTVDGLVLDNGQHILIGAYTQTLRLMRTVGVDVDAAMLRLPLRLVDPEGAGLRLPAGPPLVAFAWAVLRQRRWRWAERLALLMTATRWAAGGFRCDAHRSVADLTGQLPMRVRRELIDPLCVAALNTPSTNASAQVFLRVLKDALSSGPGSADLLLPRIDLSGLLPTAAARWLAVAGVSLNLSCRVHAIARLDVEQWRLEVGGAPCAGMPFDFDHLVLACAPRESARLVRLIAPAWSVAAEALQHEPIVTVYLPTDGARLREPMLVLADDADSPAQFVFDRGQLGGPAGLLAFVISGAADWVGRGRASILASIERQARCLLGDGIRLGRPVIVTEKRATFRSTPGLCRPGMRIAPGLSAAGDHVAGPYPATLEGAVRSGVAAAREIGSRNPSSVDADGAGPRDDGEPVPDTRRHGALNGARKARPGARQ